MGGWFLRPHKARRQLMASLACDVGTFHMREIHGMVKDILLLLFRFLHPLPIHCELNSSWIVLHIFPCSLVVQRSLSPEFTPW